jgi:hypothetical protein
MSHLTSRSEAPVSKSAPPTRARRAKRENGGLGEDPPGSPMYHLHPGPKPLLVSQLYPRERAERSEKTGDWGRIPQEVRCTTYRSEGSVEVAGVRGGWPAREKAIRRLSGPWTCQPTRGSGRLAPGPLRLSSLEPCSRPYGQS